jgi:hypothetical protein
MTIQKKRGGGCDKPSQKTTELNVDNLSTSEKLLSFPTKINNNNNSQNPSSVGNKSYRSNNKKRSNNGLCCPFACPNCASLGEYVESRYNSLSILSDTGDSIFDPLHEKYHEEHKNSIRNGGGKVFLSADLVIDSFFQQQKFKK